MKIYKLLIISALLFSSCSHDEYTYTGTVVERRRLDPTSGYKTHTDEKFIIFLKEDSTKKVIRIEVTVPTYYRLKDGDRTAFTLSNHQMYRLGNTTDRDKNLWEQ